MRIALIGDIHAFRLQMPMRGLLSKRLLGQANLWLNRRHAFDHTIIEFMVQRVAAIKPDMLLLPGDLTTTALEGEFDDVAKMLEPITRHVPTVAVPGNHDRYTFTARRRRRMERMLHLIVPAEFPHLRPIKDSWKLLALDAAVPRLVTARGRLGPTQLGKIREMLSGLQCGQGVVVLCHYPLKSPPRALPLTWDHKLADSAELRRMLTGCPARVVYMHGHIHRPWCWQPRHSDQSHFTYINAGAPCMTSVKHPLGQGFWQVDLPDNPADALKVTHHIPALTTDGRGKRVPVGRGHWESKQVL